MSCGLFHLRDMAQSQVVYILLMVLATDDLSVSGGSSVSLVLSCMVNIPS